MATFVKNTQRLKPFRQHAETDVVKNTDDPVNKTGIGNAGSSYTNTVSFRYGAAATVEPCASGTQPLGLTLWDVAEVDENGEKLIYNPRKAAEMQAVVSGQAVPVLTKGIVLYSGNLTSGGADSVGAGVPIYADALRNGDISASATESTGSAAQTKIGTTLGAVDEDGFILLKIDI